MFLMYIRYKTLISTLLLWCTLAAPALGATQQAWHADGNWWLSQTQSAKEAHLLGVMDGLLLQESLVLRSHIDGENDSNVILKKQAESMAAPRRLLKNLNSNQVRDGLDSFYADFRNRQISLPLALQIVIYQINAESPLVIENLINSFRKIRD